jgi:hypothetical protein
LSALPKENVWVFKTANVKVKGGLRSDFENLLDSKLPNLLSPKERQGEKSIAGDETGRNNNLGQYLLASKAIII